jgi:hypothetical protein
MTTTSTDPTLFRYIICYEQNGAQFHYEFDAEDEDHAVEQYHSAEGDEAPRIVSIQRFAEVELDEDATCAFFGEIFAQLGAFDDENDESNRVLLDDDGLVTITLTRRQRRLLRNTFSAHVQDEAAKIQSYGAELRPFFEDHSARLKEIVNLLFDEPEYKAFSGLPVDEPHVHLPV